MPSTWAAVFGGRTGGLNLPGLLLDDFVLYDVPLSILEAGRTRLPEKDAAYLPVVEAGVRRSMDYMADLQRWGGWQYLYTWPTLIGSSAQGREFVDFDCVAEPDALAVLLEHAREPEVAGVGGSYGNMRPNSLVACLIHEEIVARHAIMPADVDFLATFNVVYRRRCLEAVGGFDERFLKAQDAELAYRMLEAGWGLRFDARSRVRHFHESTLRPYLSTQMKQGFWRVSLYAEHPVRLGGDRYSSHIDHVQPPLALLLLALLPLTPLPPVALLFSAGIGLLALLQMPMALRLARRTRDPRYLAFVGFGPIRAFARAIGMAAACYRQSQKLFDRRYAS